MARVTSPDGQASYDDTLSLTRDEMRQALGDKDVSANDTYLLKDSTYDKMLASYAQAEGTARLAESLASTYAQEPDSVDINGNITVSWRDRVKQWMEIAASSRSYVAPAVAPTIRIDAIDHIHDPYMYWPDDRRLLR